MDPFERVVENGAAIVPTVLKPEPVTNSTNKALKKQGTAKRRINKGHNYGKNASSGDLIEQAKQLSRDKNIELTANQEGLHYVETPRNQTTTTQKNETEGNKTKRGRLWEKLESAINRLKLLSWLGHILFKIFKIKA